MDLATRIRDAIQPTHTAIENVSLSKAMIGGYVSREEYLNLLQQLRSIHAVLEAELAKHPELLGLWLPSMNRTNVLERDLEALGSEEEFSDLPETRRIIAAIQNWSVKSPFGLIGALYIFEGSRMGSMALARPVAASLGVSVEPGRGVDYHIDGIRERPRNWGIFKVAINSAPISEEQAEQLLQAAIETMDMLHSLYAEISATMREPAAAVR